MKFKHLKTSHFLHRKSIISPRKATAFQVESYLRKYFQDKRRKRVYPSEVAVKLGIDYELVRYAFDALAKEGLVERD